MSGRRGKIHRQGHQGHQGAPQGGARMIFLVRGRIAGSRSEPLVSLVVDLQTAAAASALAAGLANRVRRTKARAPKAVKISISATSAQNPAPAPWAETSVRCASPGQTKAKKMNRPKAWTRTAGRIEPVT